MTLPLAHVDDRIFPAVWKLLRIRLMISIRGFLRAKTRKKIGLIFLYVFIAALVVGVFVGSYYLLGFLTSKDFASFIGNPLPFLLSLPTMLITAGMFIIFLTSFGVLLSALYLSGDMDFLLSAPIPIRSVFVSKMLQAILPNFGLLCLLILPVLFGLGAALGFNLLYYPVMLLVIAALALAVASFASLLVMVLARFVSPRRLAEVLAFFVGIISFTLGQSGNFFRALNVNVSDSQVTSALQGFTRFNTPWSPLAWAGQGLVNLGQATGCLPPVFCSLR
jgi:ABC-2 type transport system permease protein